MLITIVSIARVLITIMSMAHALSVARVLITIVSMAHAYNHSEYGSCAYNHSEYGSRL